MEAYKERFAEEYRELKRRTDRLEEMLGDFDAGELDFEPKCPIELLYAQLNAMIEYLAILDERKTIEGIDIEEGE